MSTDSEHIRPPTATGGRTNRTRSRYLVFGLISVALLLGSIAGSSISVAFPNMIGALNTTLILAGWVLSVNQLIGTAAMPVAGKAADIFGRKTVFVASLSLFTIGSLACALSPNIGLLIVSRAVQALGQGALMPSASGIVADYFPDRRQQMLGLFTSIFPIGQIVGPNVAGWLIEAYGWRSIFWVNIPFGVAIVVAAMLMLKSTTGREAKLDLAGTGLFTGSLFALMAGLSELGDSSGAIPAVIIPVLFAASVGLMVLFVFRERRVKDPVIDLAILTKKQFLAANIYNFVYGACVLGIMSLIPLFGVTVYALSTLQSGLILTPRSIGMIVMSTVTSVSLPKWGYRWPMLLGTLVTMGTFAILGFEIGGIDLGGMHLSGTFLLFGFLGLVGLGMGTAAPAANNACIELMPDRVSTIIGIRGMFRQFGGAIGIALATLALHNTADISAGFRLVFFTSSVLMALMIPCIFIMPNSTEVKSA
jgi:EmrB/QacA subfamily drug resistance transporter